MSELTVKTLLFRDEDILRICREHISAICGVVLQKMGKHGSEEDDRIEQEQERLHKVSDQIETDVELRIKIFNEALRRRFDENTEIEYSSYLAESSFFEIETPDWAEAPSWANSHGFCNIQGDSNYGQWCYMSGTRPLGFLNITNRS